MPAETILKLLENGKWHYLKDVTKKTSIAPFNVETITNFLAEYDFVKLDEKRQKVKLDSLTNNFFKRIQQLEKESF